MKYAKVKWAIDESVSPVTQKHCRVLSHLLDKVDDELERLFDAEIVGPVTDTSEWIPQMKLDCVLIWPKLIKKLNG